MCDDRRHLESHERAENKSIDESSSKLLMQKLTSSSSEIDKLLEVANSLGNKSDVGKENTVRRNRQWKNHTEGNNVQAISSRVKRKSYVQRRKLFSLENVGHDKTILHTKSSQTCSSRKRNSHEKLRQIFNDAQNEKDVKKRAHLILSLVEQGGRLGNQLAASLIDAHVKTAICEIKTHQKRLKLEEIKRRREEIEAKRIEAIMESSSELRRMRLKNMATNERSKLIKSQALLLVTYLGVRVMKMQTVLVKYRKKKTDAQLKNSSATVITSQIRLFVRRKKRKRIEWAKCVLRKYLMIYHKQRMFQQMVESCTILSDFLESLNRISTFNGCMKLLIRGKEWKAYKKRIVLVQRYWRLHLNLILAQTKAIDRQWTLFYDQKLMSDIESKFANDTRRIGKENALITAANRTRRALRMRPLPLLKPRSREKIRLSLLKTKEYDITIEGYNRVPREVRLGVIRSYLKNLRILYVQEMKKYQLRQKKYQRDMVRRECQLNFLRRYDASLLSENMHCRKKPPDTKLVKRRSNRERRKSSCSSISHCNLFQSSWVAPIPPIFSCLMRKEALDEAVDLSTLYVDWIRNRWMPNNLLDIKSLEEDEFNEKFQSLDVSAHCKKLLQKIDGVFSFDSENNLHMLYLSPIPHEVFKPRLQDENMTIFN